MGFLTYFTEIAPTFGPLAWLFFLAQILAVGAGAYLYSMHRERNAARQAFTRNLGLALMIFGGVGVALGVLRMFNLPVLNQRFWFWIQFVLELGVAGYALYYSRSVLPALEKAAAANRSNRPGASRLPRPPRPIPVDPASVAPRPVATTTRRDARRDRKRRTR